MEACAQWPRTRLPASYYRAFRSNVPTLLVSGNLDPVTPPHWGEEARRSLPNSIHVVLPGGHAEGNECLEGIAGRVFRTGTVKGVDTSCVTALHNPPFVLPTAAAK
jgi:pimeloyl-ACP methyl ester carboxylesterase